MFWKVYGSAKNEHKLLTLSCEHRQIHIRETTISSSKSISKFVENYWWITYVFEPIWNRYLDQPTRVICGFIQHVVSSKKESYFSLETL